jgi:hypothetical protein
MFHPMMTAALHTMGILVLFLFTHWMATILYTTFCVQTSLVGLAYSFFTASSPMCRTILEIQYRTIGFYDAMFYFISTIIVQTLSGLVQRTKERETKE